MIKYELNSGLFIISEKVVQIDISPMPTLFLSGESVH